ncbi:ABC transporter substrate-binding protein [Brucella cytisi]|uniref:Histidine kinase n=1 Tax=Brucella cytisi TaxID=407152 RepID=A0A1J6I7U2_9HYPH|nr:substrate-binding domain-containing protein [Brucella cytisi]OIS91048.1 histidine kinase [Brucella cytisi]
MKRIILQFCAVLILIVPSWHNTHAQNDPVSKPEFQIVGDIAPETIAPVQAGLTRQLPGVNIAYRQIRPGEWTSRLLAGAEEASTADLVILSTPDLAVLIANEGGAQPRNGIVRNAGLTPQAHWRSELFSIGFDPAVSVVRRRALDNELPTTRIELARLLEQNAPRFQRRVGVVNIGIDNVSYTLAAQDSIRSPLFWRIVRAFGASQARIFDTSEELLQALSAGSIDLAYNVSLSDVSKWQYDARNFTVIIPQDYVVALPWTALIPDRSRHANIAEQAITFLLSSNGQAILQETGLVSETSPTDVASLQPVELGPELLVYLDGLKRSRFLDTWFQLIVHE